MSMGGVALRGYTPTTKPGKTREPPTDPNGTKAATINNYLIILTLYSSGKQRKRKSRDYFPACHYLKNFPPLQFNLARSIHTLTGA
jgi:hypothetical protein